MTDLHQDLARLVPIISAEEVMFVLSVFLILREKPTLQSLLNCTAFRFRKVYISK